MKSQSTLIPLSRIEAFSDGVIAIIITLMMFSIKVPTIESTATSTMIWERLSTMVEPFLSYLLSFIMVGVLWVNHHQFLMQLKHADRKLLWHNLHLLFWMSLIPIPTNFLGQDYKRPELTAVYGFVMFMCAFAFYWMRMYVEKVDLFIDNISPELKKKASIKLGISTGLYLISIFAGFVSVYISIAIFIAIAFAYFMPTNIEVKENKSE
jgi:uncharacterized membrane protein